jgi:AraC-like DNA-binding protein
VRQVPDVQALIADPHGTFLVRRRLAYCAVSPALVSVIAWGHITAGDADELGEILTAQERAEVRPHASLVQFQHIESVDELAVQRIAAFMRAHHDAQARLVTQEAVVRGDGPIGMMVAGFYDVVAPPYPVRVVGTVAEGLAWLGFAAAQIDAWSAELAAALATAQRTDDVVVALRDLLSGHHASIDSAEAARRLGVSERTLQRRLHAADTTFQTELLAARVRAAQNLLLRTDLDVKAIALQVGAPSPQSFSQLFRQLTGETPSGWRARHRR